MNNLSFLQDFFYFFINIYFFKISFCKKHIFFYFIALCPVLSYKKDANVKRYFNNKKKYWRTNFMKRPFIKTIRGRVILVVSILILMIGIGISSASYLFFQRNLKKTIVQSTETNLELLAENINGPLDTIRNFLSWCQANDQLSKFLLTPKGTVGYARTTAFATEVLNTNMPSTDYIQRLVIGTENRSDFLQVVSANYSIDKPLPRMIRELPYYEEHMKIKKLDELSFHVTGEPFTRRQTRIIPIIRPFPHPYSGGNAGFIYLAVSQDLFINEMQSYAHDSENQLLFSIGDTDYLVKNNTAIPLSGLIFTSSSDSKNSIMKNTCIRRLTMNERKYLAITRPLSFHGCSVTQLIPAAHFRQQSQQYFLLIALIFLAIMLVGNILIFVLTSIFTKPVEKLRNRLSLIAGGDFTQDEGILWDNELGDMGHDINQLSRDIDELINRRLEYENQKRDYEYQLLQSQINPHFLYNTLNSIKWMATIQNAPGIAEMTLALSRLLKNISKGTTMQVTIRQEFDLLNDYFTIQKYRYGGTITMDYVITDQTLLDNVIPRFSLQPIVENAIFHGIEPKGQAGNIVIRLFAPDAQTVQIDVRDNGVGIAPEKLQELLTDNTPDRGSFFRNVGVSNVHKRLQYTYGEAFGLRITSETGAFTTVSTLLPRKNPD